MNRNTDKDDLSEFEIALEQTPAPEAPLPLEVELLLTLEETGAVFSDERAALTAIESAFDAAGDVRASETLAFIFARLPGGRRGAELRAALLGGLDSNGAEMARQFGTSRQSWHQRVSRLRAAIFKKR